MEFFRERTEAEKFASMIEQLDFSKYTARDRDSKKEIKQIEEKPHVWPWAKVLENLA